MKNFLILVIALLANVNLISQTSTVLNDEIGIYIKVTELDYTGSYDDYGQLGEGDPEPAWRIRFKLRSTETNSCGLGGSTLANKCYTATNGSSFNPNSVLVNVNQQPKGMLWFTSVQCWENDDIDSDDYCAIDENDDDEECSISWGSDPTNTFWPSQPITVAGGSSNSDVGFERLWYQTNGHGMSNPLVFGYAQPGITYRHTNYNRGYTNNSNLGYRNQFGSISDQNQPSNDVTYQFEVSEPQLVNIKVTCRNILNGNTSNGYVHILREENGSFNHLSTTTSDTVEITENFCPGKYYVVVEGAGSFNDMKFTVTLNVEDLPDGTIEGGLISNADNQFVLSEGFESIFESSMDAYTDLPPLVYNWQLRGVYTSANHPDEIIDLNIDAASQDLAAKYSHFDTIYLTRTASNICYSAPSNTIKMNSIFPARINELDNFCKPAFVVNNDIDNTFILPGIYSSSELKALGSVQTVEPVIFKAEEIILNPGFTVALNSEFEVISYNCADEVVALFDFNDNSLRDYSYNNFLGEGNVSFGTDRFGKENSSLYFNGIDNYMTVDDHPSLTLNENMSFSFWVKSDVTSGESFEYILSKGRDNSFNTLWFRKWRLAAVKNDTEQYNGGDFSLNDNQWYHCAIVIAPTSIKLFVDGLLVLNESLETPFNLDNSHPLVLGRHFTNTDGSGGYEYWYKGYLDDLKIYSETLSQSQISQLSNDRP